MANEITKRIMQMVDRAEQKKRSIDDAIKNLKNQRDADRRRALRDTLALNSMNNESEVIKNLHVQRLAQETKQVMSENHELAELQRKRADVDKKISEIKHWTSQSEYEDERKRSEALSYATRAFNGI